MKAPASCRVLLKISGEALGGRELGLSGDQLKLIAQTLVQASQKGIEIGVVVGGGNFLRGAQTQLPIRRVTADYLGMLATVMNGLAMRDALLAEGAEVSVFSALPIQNLVESFYLPRVMEALDLGKIAIFVGGTGNPLVTTDSTASLRAVEIEADVLLKASTVDGVYDADPRRFPHARRFERLTFDQALDLRLGVMDISAFAQCREFNIPIRVFDLFKPGALLSALLGGEEGTLVVR